jgi:hypothetical protein
VDLVVHMPNFQDATLLPFYLLSEEHFESSFNRGREHAAYCRSETDIYGTWLAHIDYTFIYTIYLFPVLISMPRQFNDSFVSGMMVMNVCKVV